MTSCFNFLFFFLAPRLVLFNKLNICFTKLSAITNELLVPSGLIYLPESCCFRTWEEKRSQKIPPKCWGVSTHLYCRAPCSSSSLNGWGKKGLDRLKEKVISSFHTCIPIVEWHGEPCLFVGFYLEDDLFSKKWIFEKCLETVPLWLIHSCI